MAHPKPGPHDSRGSDTRDASYAVDPNTHRSQEAGPQEPVDPGKAGDLMIGKNTGGKDSFRSEGM